MNKNLLKREFGHAGGNLYEGETKDIDQHLDQENGDDTTQKDLQTLAAAARQPAAKRMQALRAVLDVEEFASFLAMEMLTASVDGYAFTKNNYRIYHQPKTDRLLFLPHWLGIDFGQRRFSAAARQPVGESALGTPGISEAVSRSTRRTRHQRLASGCLDESRGWNGGAPHRRSA